MSPTETKSNTKREIEVEVPPEEVARETEALIQKYQKVARLPGFRRGHVPPSIIRQRFAADIKNDVVDALVPRYFRKETDKLGLIPVSQPRVTDLHVHEGEPLRFKASFEVMPTIRPEGYKELRADKPAVSVTDEEVEESLNSVREQHAAFTSVEGRPLAEGDFAQVSLDGQPKDGEGQPVHMDDILVEIGGKNTMPEFNENLRGVPAGEERSFDVNYPADSADKRLAGKTFKYTVKVLSIKQKSLPELNDQFAKELGEFANLDEVKQRIREIAAFLLVARARQEVGLTSDPPTLHMAFTGNPGTGKTTVALRIASILHKLGFVRRGQVVSVTRDELVGQYIGHTAPKTKEILKKAMGGVLFIDEAYYLHRPDNERDYGQEAIEILLQVMESQREDLVVILAGYGDRMDKFFASNPGFRSRIAHHIDFPDYTDDELLAIAERMLRDINYKFSPDAREAFIRYIGLRKVQPLFSNARSIRNALDRIRLRQANRLVADLDSVLTADDIISLEASDVFASRVFLKASSGA